MHAFSHRPTAAGKEQPTAATMPAPRSSPQSPGGVRSILDLQHAIGNQAVRRSLQAEADGAHAGPTADQRRAPVLPGQSWQPTLKIGSAPRSLIHRTTVGDVLDNFFSPFSRPRLWVMPASDNYTRIVRTWQPVIDAVNQLKADLEANCETWNTSHRTDPSWTPGMTDPPVTDPNAQAKWVGSPPGTDPATCQRAFIPYVASKGISLLPGMAPLPPIQTFELYTCSIGSFGIYATVDSIDCTAKTARMKIWMYNAMDRGSFGRYASHPAFALSGMERQYMWWTWTENHTWGAAGTPTGGSGGGSGTW